jgi:hypothetical protein
MSERLIARFNGWRFRVQLGDKRAQSYFYAFLLGTMAFLFDWAGSRGSWGRWDDPRPMSEILWHFPVLVGGVFVAYRWWYRNT